MLEVTLKMKKVKIKKLVISILTPIIVVIVFMVFFELGLRIFGRGPKGIFLGWTPGKNGLYPENAYIKMPGPIPYTIKVNSQGFRSPEIRQTNSLQRVRIAAVGDSVTDGFYVDNEATYPYFLRKLLQKDGWDVEVINAAHGGGSINKELAILRKNVLPFDPDIVILLFVSNDIADIRGISREDLVDQKTYLNQSYQSPSLFRFFITRTAIGELFYDTYLHLKSPAYRRAKELLENPNDRYQIKGGNNHRRNVQLFRERFKATDGLVLREPFSLEVNVLLENYFFALKEFARVCQVHGITLLFVYFPAYSQVYNPASSGKIQKVLATQCARLSIPFLDLTQIFREQGNTRILHLAPVDFHLNPEGNRVMAAGIARYLHARILPHVKK